MKKIYFCFLIMFLTFSLSSCTISNGNNVDIKPFDVKETVNIKRLAKVEYPSKDKTNKTVSASLEKSINDFNEKMMLEIYKSGENCVYSPISIYMGLSMLLEGVSDDTAFNELMTLLNLDLQTLENELQKAYITDYYTNDNGKLYMANSIWINNNSQIKSSYLDILKEKYFAESYHVNFNEDETKKVIIDWINHYTENLLQLTPNNYKIDNNVKIMLLNTIYFNNKWEQEFKKESEKDDSFYVSSDYIVTAKSMYHTLYTSYKITEEYTFVKDYFHNGNYIVYIMPNDYDLKTVLENGFNYYKKDLDKAKVNLTVFQFETLSNYDLTEGIKNLGVNKIFYEGVLDKIGDNLVLSQIKQDIGIKLSRLGVEAAATTRINEGAASGPSEYVYIKLDKPFVYAIYDINNLPLFVGTMFNPSFE